jgi:hypothetical protein
MSTRISPDDRPVLITGGSGFVGTNVAHRVLGTTSRPVILWAVDHCLANFDEFSDSSAPTRRVGGHATSCDRLIPSRRRLPTPTPTCTRPESFVT